MNINKEVEIAVTQLVRRSSGVGLALAGATELVTLLFLARTHSFSLFSGCVECGMCIVCTIGFIGEVECQVQVDIFDDLSKSFKNDNLYKTSLELVMAHQTLPIFGKNERKRGVSLAQFGSTFSRKTCRMDVKLFVYTQLNISKIYVRLRQADNVKRYEISEAIKTRGFQVLKQHML